jgi:hypothetical protein
MIHGVAMRWPSAIRTIDETTTIPVSHAHAGIATARPRTAAVLVT